MNKLCLIFALGVTSVSVAQDVQFSQFYANPAYLNPGFAGTSTQHRMVGNYRHQWPAIAGTYVSYQASYDNNMADYNSGIGFRVIHDRAGSGGLSFTKIAMQYAYEIKLNYKTFLRPAIEYGMAWRYIDPSRLVFGDQLVRQNGTGQQFSTFEFIEDQRHNYFDLSSGVLLYTEKLWAGVAVKHMNQPNESLLGNEAKLPAKLSIHAGYRIPIKDFFGYHNKNYIIPAIHYKAQGKFDQFDVGFYFERNPMTIGFWYRGIPGLKAYEPGYANNDALIMLIGFRAKDKFKFGYSYDITISRLVTNTAGSHEISIVYEWAGIKESLSRTTKNVACPKF